MALREDYLDNLLNGLNEPESETLSESDEKEELMDKSATIGVDDTSKLSEDDIVRLLSEGEETFKEEIPVQAEENSADLMDLLSQKDDSDLQEIQELLQKADNNEAVSEDIVALLQDIPDEIGNSLEEMSQESVEKEALLSDEKAQRAAERKREREARKAEKAALKEAKKAARLEAKAAKEAEKRAKKEALAASVNVQEQKADTPENNTYESESYVPENQASDGVDVQQMFGEVDLSGLDALFANLESGDVSKKDSNVNVLKSSADEALSTEETTASLVEKVVAEDRPQKRRIFSRIIDFLTEEVEEEEDSKDNNNENIQLSDENRNIIDELDKEKGKKKKGNKGKKLKKTSENNSDGESEEESTGDKKSKKEKKSKKTKVPTEPATEEIELNGGSKLSFKKILPVALVCVTLAAVLILVSNLAGDYSAKKTGREAYYIGDYETCYQNLYGKDLNESEQVMYSRSESILRIRLWIREYEMFAEEGAEAEALDSLLQSVNDYPVLYAYASQWNAGPDVEESYAQIINILDEKYHLTEAQAIEIASTKDDVEYSKMVYTIADGGEFGSWIQSKEEEPEVLPDVLPEEEDLGDTSFVDNNN